MVNEIGWTVLPRGCRADGDATIWLVSVHVSARIHEEHESPPRPFDFWPVWVLSNLKVGTFGIGDPSPLVGRLDQAIVGSERSVEMWSCLIGAAPVKPFQQQTRNAREVWAENVRAEPVLIATSNRAFAVRERLLEIKQSAFELVADRSLGHRSSRTGASFREMTVSDRRQDLEGLWLWRSDSASRIRGPETLTEGAQEVDRFLRAITSPALRRVVERNLFRLADRPYEQLTDSALRTFLEATTAAYPDTRAAFKAACKNAVLKTAEFNRELMNTLIFHRRVRDRRSAEHRTYEAEQETNQDLDFHRPYIPQIASVFPRDFLMVMIGSHRWMSGRA